MRPVHGWPLYSHWNDLTELSFPDAWFDHTYSICAFEHLLRQAALMEIARALIPGGALSITLDFGGSGVHLAGMGPDHTPEKLIRLPEDVAHRFFSCDLLEPAGGAPSTTTGSATLPWPEEPV